MLTELAVRDLGVVAELSVSLRDGLTAVTGETGAGKTLVVGALDLLLGGRADASVVRAGAAEAVVEARFVVGDDEHVLRRVVPADGRSRAYVDGRLVTATELAEAGAALAEIHGQHAHQVLRDPAAQRAALDAFGEVDLSALTTARREVARLRGELDALGGDERARVRELDLLRFQVDELEAASLEDRDEEERLRAEQDLLADLESLRSAASTAHGLLADDDGALDRARAAAAALQANAVFEAPVSRLTAIVEELADVAAVVRDQVGELEDDPARVEEVGRRLRLLGELRRKYGEDLGAVIAYHADVRDRLDRLERHEQLAAELEGELARAIEAEAAEAGRVRAARAAAAPRLAAAVEGHLEALALGGARIEVLVDGADGGAVDLLLAANPGEPARPLAKVASGGELSRLMLALRLVLSNAPPTLVFDEVDAGLGGEAGLAVGARLAELARDHQVLVVTHLAQVAACAHHHLVVSKSATSGRTTSGVSEVTGEERTREVARMLSGHPDSDTGREHAAELLERAAGASHPTRV